MKTISYLVVVGHPNTFAATQVEWIAITEHKDIGDESIKAVADKCS